MTGLASRGALLRTRAATTWRCAGRTALVLVLAVLTGRCAAESSGWISVPFVDPLRFSSLPLQAYQENAPQPRGWEVAVASAYFNVWELSGETTALHQQLGVQRSPLTDGQIKLLEARFPRDQFYQVDLEGTRTDVIIARDLGHGVAVTLDVPWISIGQPHWDAIPEGFHRTFGLYNQGREWFPRGQSVVFIRGRNGAIRTGSPEFRETIAARKLAGDAL